MFFLSSRSLHLSPGSGSTREVLKTWRCQIKGATEIAFGCRRAPSHQKRKYEIQNKKKKWKKRISRRKQAKQVRLTWSWRLVDCDAVEYLERKTCGKLPFDDGEKETERKRERGGSKALIAHYWAHFMSHIAGADADAAAGTTLIELSMRLEAMTCPPPQLDQVALAGQFPVSSLQSGVHLKPSAKLHSFSSGKLEKLSLGCFCCGFCWSCCCGCCCC